MLDVSFDINYNYKKSQKWASQIVLMNSANISLVLQLAQFEIKPNVYLISSNSIPNSYSSIVTL